jgi:hypothetical protein
VKDTGETLHYNNNNYYYYIIYYPECCGQVILTNIITDGARIIAIQSWLDFYHIMLKPIYYYCWKRIKGVVITDFLKVVYIHTYYCNKPFIICLDKTLLFYPIQGKFFTLYIFYCMIIYLCTWSRDDPTLCWESKRWKSTEQIEIERGSYFLSEVIKTLVYLYCTLATIHANVSRMVNEEK